MYHKYRNSPIIFTQEAYTIALFTWQVDAIELPEWPDRRLMLSLQPRQPIVILAWLNTELLLYNMSNYVSYVTGETL